MELEDAKKILMVSPEEESSIKKYLNFYHASINILGNFNLYDYYKLSKDGRMLPTNEEELKIAINDFINLYSAIYKESKGKKINYRLLRGTNIGNVSNTLQFLSTTKKRDIAERFCSAENGVVVYYNIEDGVPFLDVQKYREKNEVDEQEIIIAPFCEIIDEKIKGSYNSFINYDVSIKKQNFEELSDLEINELYDGILTSLSKNLQGIKEAGKLNENLMYREDEDGLGNYYNRLCENFQRKADKAEQEYKMALFNKDEKKAKESLEAKEYYLEKIEEVKNDEKVAMLKLKKIRNSTNSFKENLQKLLKGLCKQKELEIDKAMETVKKQELLTELSSKLSNVLNNGNRLEAVVVKTYEDLMSIEKNIKNISENLGIITPKTVSETNIKHNIFEIKENIKNAIEKMSRINLNSDNSFEDVKQMSDYLVPLLDGISYGIEVSSDFAQIINMHKLQMQNEVARNLHIKVQTIIQNIKIEKYQNERKEIGNKKVGFFGKLMGKDILKEEQLKNIDLKIKLLGMPISVSEQKYNIQDMLVDIQAFVMEDLHGKFAPELANLYNTIVYTFDNKDSINFANEYISELARKKILDKEKSELPQLQVKKYRFFGRIKSQLEELKLENDNLKIKISSNMGSKRFNFERNKITSNALELIEHKLIGINSTSKGEEQVRVDPDREPTADIWSK